MKKRGGRVAIQTWTREGGVGRMFSQDRTVLTSSPRNWPKSGWLTPIDADSLAGPIFCLFPFFVLAVLNWDTCCAGRPHTASDVRKALPR